MSSITPNIGIYLPRTGESNYTDSFNSGMINIDQHDHSGGPNKGLPISGGGLANFSVTYEKLNSNVVDPTTGIGVNSTPGLQNQLQILGILKNLYTLAGVPGVGFVGMNGATVTPLVFQNSSTVTWTNADGSGGNPSAAVNIAGLYPVVVANGGTGNTSLTAYSVLLGGTTSTAAMQQVTGLGTLGQVLVSQGAAAKPIWSSNFVQPTRPCFFAYVGTTTAGVTGDGTVYRINFDTESFDQASNFVTGNTGTSGFTAPLTGIYQFTINLNIASNVASHAKTMELDFFVNNASAWTPIYCEFDNIVDASGFLNISASQTISLNAGDLVYPVLTCSDASTLSVKVGKYTAFSGFIIC